MLSAMGIPVWQYRNNVVEDVTSEDDNVVEQVDNNVLLARIEQATWLFCHDSDNTQQTQRLVQSILLAIDVPMTQVCLLTTAELKALESETIAKAEHKQLLTFGESIVKQLLGESATVEQHCYEPQFTLNSELTTLVNVGLDSLLTAPETKKQLWQSLRHLRPTT
jgi:hypothetical protein